MELVGGKKKVQKKMKKGYSAAETEPAMKIMSQKQIMVSYITSENILKKDNLDLVSIGKILQSLEGCACPMGILSREFLRKLSLASDEIAIVDMEAGIEHFGRGVETSIDTVLVVVEPSFESLQLAERINSLSRGIGINNVWAVLSKAPPNGIAAKLKGKLDTMGIDMIGCIHYNAEIFQSCLAGHIFGKGKAGEEIIDVFDSLVSKANPGH
jgi:CO dehydrogenase maturation factor